MILSPTNKGSGNSLGFNFIKNALAEINKFDDVPEKDSKLVNGNPKLFLEIKFIFIEKTSTIYKYKSAHNRRSALSPELNEDNHFVL